MKYDVYSDLSIIDDYSVIDFTSIGMKGAIAKRIASTATELTNVYNLAFGDIDENGEIDDTAISNNGDRNKILATIVFVVDFYTKKYPERWILFKGSTKERIRLYRMAVGINLEELSSKFEIFAYVQNGLVPFAKDMDINAFLLKRKFV